MESLLDEAKKIIEMSLNPQSNTDAYSSKAREWLAKVKADQQTSKEPHHHDIGVSCTMCGNDLLCPSCDEG